MQPVPTSRTPASSMKTKVFYVFFSLSLFAMFSGCGEKLPYEVVRTRGTVTFDGRPAPKGLRLQFAPIGGEGRTSEAIVGDEGKFKAVYTRSVEGIQVGKITLTVSWGGGTPPPEVAEIIEKYGGNTKGFPLEITKPDKEFKIEL